MKKTFKLGVWAILTLVLTAKLSAQSMVDLSVGASHQDNFFANMAYRCQVSNKFRVGIEGQYGTAKYRLINAKPITTGYATSLGLPLTIRLYEKEQIRLDLYAKPSVRFQGVLDPDNNDERDSVLTSTAFSFETGLLVTINVSEKANFQSGVTFPLFLQTQPSSLFENVYPGLLHFGGNYRLSAKTTAFIKTAFGPAVGGGGDTQKFGWSLQGGIRYVLGTKPMPSFVEPSF